MIYSIFVFILLVIISGAIAYLGDYIGRYLGKKRLTFMGLRPKYTAIVSTIITGMVISFLVLMFLTFINKEFRQVVFHGKQIIANNKKLEAESEKLSNNNKKLVESNNNLKEEQNKLKTKSNLLERTIKVLEDKNINLKKTSKSFELKSLLLQDKSKYLESNIKKLTINYKKNLENLRKTQKAKKDAEKNINILVNSISKQEKELKELSSKSNNLSDLLLEKQYALDTNIEKLKEKEADLVDIDAQLDEAKKNLDNTLRALDIANLELESYSELRVNDVVLRQDDEILRSVIDNTNSINEIKIELNKVLNLTKNRCEKFSKNFTNHNRGINLAYKTENGEILIVDEDVLIEQAALLIKQSNGNSFVVFSSAGNFTAKDIDKEPIIVQMKIFEDKKLFKKGDIVLNKYFDGKLNEPYVFSDVYDFVNTTLPKNLYDKGMMLRQHSYMANNSNNITQNIEVQLNLTRKIKSESSLVLVNVRTKEDLYSHSIYSPDLFEYEVVKAK